MIERMTMIVIHSQISEGRRDIGSDCKGRGDSRRPFHVVQGHFEVLGNVGDPEPLARKRSIGDELSWRLIEFRSLIELQSLGMR